MWPFKKKARVPEILPEGPLRELAERHMTLNNKSRVWVSAAICPKCRKGSYLFADTPPQGDQMVLQAKEEFSPRLTPVHCPHCKKGPIFATWRYFEK